ncbi:hypothetical protein AaE_003409 [Aphanomyces astaci]|uniref:F-box domain-containing protein n=1 Tax=Aphanomyces astaci TaxID=112090 RepID=A0A6A5AS96_APHAT|nr:hypothetical protein AaE_003409 [Aphanomyces astaci]
MVNTHVHVVIPPSRQDNQQQQQHSPSSVKAASVHPATDALPEDDSHAAMHGATFTASQSKLPKLFDSNNHNIGDDDLMGDASVCTPPQVQLPGDMVRAILGFVDGASLVACTSVCTTWNVQTQGRELWKTACLRKWPSLHHQLLPQLPGAPDYDIIRLYGGSWKSCYLQHHKVYRRSLLSPSPLIMSTRNAKRPNARF